MLFSELARVARHKSSRDYLDSHFLPVIRAGAQTFFHCIFFTHRAVPVDPPRSSSSSVADRALFPRFSVTHGVSPSYIHPAKKKSYTSLRAEEEVVHSASRLAQPEPSGARSCNPCTGSPHIYCARAAVSAAADTRGISRCSRQVCVCAERRGSTSFEPLITSAVPEFFREASTFSAHQRGLRTHATSLRSTTVRSLNVPSNANCFPIAHTASDERDCLH